ncbi:APC family permease [soil metagenome]
MANATATLKRVALGRPQATQEYRHSLLPKWMALPIFSSDPFSSVAYATQEMMLVLVLAGAGAFSLVRPLSAAVAVILAVVVVSYRQTVHAYPNGGGAYIVSHRNLGKMPGLVAASSLLVDYVLTVAVSIAAGVEQIASVFTGLHDYAVPAALGFVVLLTLINLRGIRESGFVFALPTYAFIATMSAMIGTGVVRCLSQCPQAETVGQAVQPVEGLTLFLVLHAFASGCTALTGVEAISNGVPAFRYPKSRNAATTLAVMGIICITLFIGVSYLATATEVVATEHMQRTVTAQIGLAVFGPGPGFWAVQAATSLILVLAGNTAYQGFPSLASVLAADRYLPRVFQSRGDRLAFSNGIVVLAVLASVLLVAFRADANQLIQLYIVGVFTSFTLSQAGMVRHWLRTREGNWRRALGIQAFGAFATAVTLVIITASKFTGGAWIVVVATPLAVFGMYRINRHYVQVRRQLRVGEPPGPSGGNHMVVVLERWDESAPHALSYARAVGPDSLRALVVGDDDGDVRRRWRELAPDVEIDGVDGAGGHAVDALRRALVAEAGRHPHAFTTALVAEAAPSSLRDEVTKHRVAFRLKTRLLFNDDIVVADVVAPHDPRVPERVGEHHVVVLVSAVDKALERALAYAKGLRPASLRAVSVNLSTDGSTDLFAAWEDLGVDVPLEVVDSPYRSITESIRQYVHRFEADGGERVLSVVIPEIVARHWYHHPLHAQTPMLIKDTLLFEPGVVTVSVPYHLRDVEMPDESVSQTTTESPPGE